MCCVYTKFTACHGPGVTPHLFCELRDVHVGLQADLEEAMVNKESVIAATSQELDAAKVTHLALAPT